MPSQTPQPRLKPDAVLGDSAIGGANVSLPPLRTKHAARLAEQRHQGGGGAAAADRSTRSVLSTSGYSRGGPTSRSTAAAMSTATSTQRRGHRNPIKQFSGASYAVANSALPPLQSALPDMSNWRNPDRRHQSVGQRMGRHPLDGTEHFESPYKCDRLQQPEALRCTPVPTAKSDYRMDVLDKPTVLRATVTSLPKSVSPILQNKLIKDLTVPDMVRVLQDAARLEGNVDGLSPAQRIEKARRRNEVMDSAEYNLGQMDDFERTVADKLAFGKFLSNKRQRLPVMVLRHFRHQLMEESALVAKLRLLPLKVIEDELEALGPRTINATQWNALMIRLVGDTFSRLDAHTLFSFFDTDIDGDVDQRELCNGFVHLRSTDGPLLSVLHRCNSFLQKNIKDTRLTFISRFELVLMAEGIAVASSEKLKPRQRESLTTALTELLNSFSTNKRGEFPFDEVRRAILRSNSIVRAIKCFTVPREPDLYASPLSVYLRNGDSDDGEQPFRLMMSVKSLDKAQRSAAAAAANSAAAGSASAALAASQLPGAGGAFGNAALESSMGTSVGNRDLDDGELDSDDSDYEAEQVRATGTLGYASAMSTSPAMWHTMNPGHGRPSIVDPGNAPTAAQQRERAMSVMSVGNASFAGGAAGDSIPGLLQQDPSQSTHRAPTTTKKAIASLMSFHGPRPETMDLLNAVPTKSNLKGGSAVATPSHGKRRATVMQPKADVEDVLSDGATSAAADDADDSEDEEDQRPVPEPGQPTFFTLRGTLYRQVDGEEPQPYWVPGMPTNVNYSERRV